MSKTMLIFGHGYTARALSARLLSEGWRVIGTSRHAEKLPELAAPGIEARLWPGDDLSDVLPFVTHILVSVPPTASGDPVLAECGTDICRISGQVQWLGYLSTTAVYGDHQGRWVDEDTALAPSTPRGRWRVAAETAWRAQAKSCDLPLHVFRLAGIYGPGRGPFAKVRSGSARRIIKPGQVFSRIHVDDIAAVVMASINAPSPMSVYNVCDDLAAPPEDVIGLAAELLGLPLPPAVDFATAELTDMARSFYAESKRVRNDRIKRDLGVRLHYPTYREGLRALLKSEKRQS